MDGDIVVSRGPDELESIRGLDVAIELKFDWEHTAILRGEVDLETHLQSADIDSERIWSVHLPPGIGRGRTDLEMALTTHNRGTISAFVHEQLGVIPNAHLVVHPPKQFVYSDQLELIATVLELTGREIAVENTSVPSDWYAPETIAFFGYVGDRYERLSGLYLTIDSAHLPTDETTASLQSADHDAISTLETRLAADGLEVPSDFRERIDRQLHAFESYLPGHDELEDGTDIPYGPVLRTLCLSGDRTKEIHLNDPLTDDVPDPTGHKSSPMFEAVLEYAIDHEIAIVLEPNELSPRALGERVSDLRELLGSVS